MSDLPAILPDDPIALKAMILALQVDNARMGADITKMVATLRAHEALVQALQIQIARLKKQKFGTSSAPDRCQLGASSAPDRSAPCARSNSWNWRSSIWRLLEPQRSA